jgi:nucleotide-binding universal stress UspA family protein
MLASHTAATRSHPPGGLSWPASAVPASPDGEDILDHVAQRDCDMPVMGFYSHSRFREMVAGGVTRHALNNTTVPVLASH